MRVHPRATCARCASCATSTACSSSATRWRPASGAPGGCSRASTRTSTPDFLCVAKGLTGGYLPLAATLTTERVYEGFLGRVRGVQDVLPRPHLHGQPARLRGRARLARRVRARAAPAPRCAAKIECSARGSPAGSRRSSGGRGAPARVHDRHRARRSSRSRHAWATEVTLAARRRGAIVRPLGDVVVLMPPLSITEAELRRLVEITAEAIAEATGAAPVCSTTAPPAWRSAAPRAQAA